MNQYNIDSKNLFTLQKEITQNITVANLEKQKKKTEFLILKSQELSKKGLLSSEKEKEINDYIIQQEIKIAQANRINQVAHTANIDEYRMITQMVND
jgi:hypothetical protein